MASSLGTLPEVLIVDQAGAILRLSRNTIYDAIERGEIPHVRIGRWILIPRGGLLRFPGTGSDAVSDTNAPGQEGIRGDSTPYEVRTGRMPGTHWGLLGTRGNNA
jgi:excisionase family DNA binding protein